ncbi:Protein aardvark (Suppressor of amiB protein 16) [Durusdinium trenchii]|uniref:Protein aardvark (Suppressor of amiB protein 16) n=1 Tax=Durusdinium trenchii TaxID=1381693 RepID=A0ABP0I386_9DINO
MLLQQVAPVQDDQVYSIVQKYGQGVNPAVTAMTGNPDDLFSNQQGGAPEQRSSGGRRDPAVTVSWWNTDELERSLSIRVLSYWGSEPARMQDVYQTGGFPPVIQAMQHFQERGAQERSGERGGRDDPGVGRYGVQFLSHAANQSSQYIHELHHLGTVPIVIQQMNQFPQDVSLQQYGCQYLCSMAQMPDIRDEIVKEGGVRPLISAMNNYPQDPMVHRYALSALSPLAYIDDYASQIIGAGGVTAVKNTLQYHSADPQVAISALGMINELAKHEGCKDSLVNAGIIPILLQVMQVHAGNPHVQALGLKCLATLCANNTAIQTGLYQAHGIPAILNAIRSAADTRATDEATVGLITEGMNLLAAIATNQECRPLIMQHGGLEITLQVMRFYIDFPLIQEHCLRILSGLTLWPEAAAKLLHAGYIDCIIAAMVKYHEHQGVQMSGAYALGMVAGGDDAKAAVISAKGIEALVAAMYWHPTDQHVNEQASAALSILCESDRGKSILAQTLVVAWMAEAKDDQSSAEIIATSMRGLYHVANTLKQIAKLVAIAGLDETMNPGSESIGVAFYVLKAIVTLAYPYPPPQMLTLCGTLLDLVIAIMKLFPSGCEVLSVLARLEEMQEPIISKGGISLICTALKAFQADTGIQRKGCRAFANLGEFQVSREAIRREGGIELIIYGMKYHVSHPEVGEQGCAALANLALDEGNRSHIAQNEGVNAVLAGLRLHQNHPGIQAFGLGALGNLATAEDNCAVILKAGAIDMVMNAMNAWKDEARVQHFACLALSNFAHDDANKVAIGRAGGNRMIISSMQKHSDHAGVQEQACGALANLGVHQQNMVEIAQLSGIELVIASLKRFPTEPGVQEKLGGPGPLLQDLDAARNGCFALSKFLTMPNESYRQRMKAADAEVQVLARPTGPEGNAALEVIKTSKPSFDVKICFWAQQRTTLCVFGTCFQWRDHESFVHQSRGMKMSRCKP